MLRLICADNRVLELFSSRKPTSNPNSIIKLRQFVPRGSRRRARGFGRALRRRIANLAQVAQIGFERGATAQLLRGARCGMRGGIEGLTRHRGWFALCRRLWLVGVAPSARRTSALSRVECRLERFLLELYRHYGPEGILART